MASVDQDPISNRPGGILGSVKGLAATLLAITHTRLELFSVELEEEWVRASSILTWSLVALFFGGIKIPWNRQKGVWGREERGKYEKESEVDLSTAPN